MEHTLLLIFSLIIEAFALWQYSELLFIPVHTVKVRIIIISIIYTFLFLLALQGIIWLNIVAYIILNLFFLLTQFQLTLVTGFFYTSILLVFMGLPELILYSLVFLFSTNFAKISGTGLFLYTVLSKMLFLSFIYLFSYTIKVQRDLSCKTNSAVFYLTMIPFSSSFIMFTFFMIGQKIGLYRPLNYLVIISSIVLFACNFLVFGINQYNQKKNKEYIEMQLSLQKEKNNVEYYRALLAQNDNRNILIHDIKNHLHSIDVLNQKRENNQVHEYILKLLNSYNLMESTKFCNNELLNAILCRYQKDFLDRNTRFHVDIRKDTLSNIEHQELTALFCNLLDNAYEATENISDAFVELSASQKENTPYTVIVMLNSCRETVNFDSRGRLISSKKNKSIHGYGTKSIHKIVDQYHGNLHMYYDPNSCIFHTIIVLQI